MASQKQVSPGNHLHCYRQETNSTKKQTSNNKKTK